MIQKKLQNLIPKGNRPREEEAKPVGIPSREMVLAEEARLQRRGRFFRTLRSTVAILLEVAAVVVLIANLWMPALQIYGTSMTPILEDGDVTVLLRTGTFQKGDVIGFYYNNKILIKRVIGTPGDWVNMDPDGTVYVNDQRLDEPYISEKSLGECDIDFPYQVPDESYFVMGDHRKVSVDSRSSLIGCVHNEQMVGKVVLRVWPLSRLSALH